MKLGLFKVRAAEVRPQCGRKWLNGFGIFRSQSEARPEGDNSRKRKKKSQPFWLDPKLCKFIYIYFSVAF